LAAIIALIVQLVVANADINSQRQRVRPSALAFLNTVRTSPAQKVDVLHKKLSLNGALCAKPARGVGDEW
jgi:hypothetical protein